MTQTARQYHQNTSYRRDSLGGHRMDWAHQPDLFKQYPGLGIFDLPEAAGYSRQSLWDLTGRRLRAVRPDVPDLPAWSRILMLSNGLSARSHGPGGFHAYRTAASAGALYPNEIYAAIFYSGAPEAGLYHFQNARMGLAQLRRGNFAPAVEAMVPCQAESTPQATVFITGILFRSAWKYRDRAWRYVLLDAGHVLQNLLLALGAEGFDTQVQYDFSDRETARFLGVDAAREGVLVCVHVFGKLDAAAPPPQLPTPIEPLDHLAPCSRVAAREIGYPQLQAAYTQSMTIEPRPNHLPDPLQRLGLPPSEWIALPEAVPLAHEMDHARAILTRRSRRNFIPAPLPRTHYSRLLQLLCNTVQPAPGAKGFEGFPLALGVLTGSIENVVPGFYLLDPLYPGGIRLGQVSSGNLIPAMTTICLDQGWLKHAALHLVCLGQLHDIDAHLGGRGYRYAMIAAGRMGQTVYLGARALGLGCCGIGAYYDDEARRLLGLQEESALLYLIAAGMVKSDP